MDADTDKHETSAPEPREPRGSAYFASIRNRCVAGMEELIQIMPEPGPPGSSPIHALTQDIARQKYEERSRRIAEERRAEKAGQERDDERERLQAQLEEKRLQRQAGRLYHLGNKSA